MNNEMTSVPLHPCPFCGQLDAFVEQLDNDSSVVICQGRVGEHSACLARGPVGVQQHDSENQPEHDGAVKDWNRRAAAQDQGDLVAALEKARDVLRAIILDKTAGVHYASAQAASHQISQALEHLAPVVEAR